MEAVVHPSHGSVAESGRESVKQERTINTCCVKRVDGMRAHSSLRRSANVSVGQSHGARACSDEQDTQGRDLKSIVKTWNALKLQAHRIYSIIMTMIHCSSICSAYIDVLGD